MKISNSIIDIINNSVLDYPQETGGILGSTDDDVIDRIVMDIPAENGESKCSYTPDVEFLNQKIVEWQTAEIAFMGIFHTHFVGVETLSCGDKSYINAIMKSMPMEIEFLYFPIFVLPDKRLICYKAQRKGNCVEIVRDEMQIIQ